MATVLNKDNAYQIIDAHLIPPRRSVSGSAPYGPQTEISLYGGVWWDSLALASGAISSWSSLDSLAQVIAQGTGAAMPTKDTTGAVFDGGDSMSRALDTTKFINRIGMPDDATTAAGATPGVGGVWCGLARVPATTDQFWALSYGPSGYQGGPGDTIRKPSFMRFRYAGGVITKLQEIQIAPLYGNATDMGMQGMCVDPSDGSLWGAVAEGTRVGQVIHVSTAGVALASVMQASWPISGIAIVPGSPNKMWFVEEAATGANIESRSMVDNSIINAAAGTGLANQDGAFYDLATNSLLVTYGANNAAGNVRVYTLNGTSGAPVYAGDIKLPNEWDAVEGIVWEGRKIYGVCDRNYHVSQAVPNAFLECDCVPPVTNFLTICATVLIPATTGTDCILEIGTPLGGNGFGLYPTSATGMNVFVNTGASGTTQQAVITGAALPSMAVIPRMVDVTFDKAGANLGTLFIDGVSKATISLATLIGGITTAQTLRIGTASDVRPITGTIKDIGFFCGAADLTKLRAYRKQRWSLP